MVLLAAVTAWAQEPAADLTPLRTKAELTDEDRGQLRAFMTTRIAKILGPNTADARVAAEELRTSYDGSDGFKRAYAAVGLELMGPGIAKAELMPATHMLSILNTFNTIEAVPVLLDTLRDERVGVRAAAVVGLRALQPKIVAAGPDMYQRVLAALKEAGKVEKSRDTLKSIYAAMDFSELPNPPDPKPAAAALLELLEARAQEYAAGEVHALGADDVGLRLSRALAGALDDNDRKRLTTVTATFMKYAVEQYVSPENRLSAVRDKSDNRAEVELRNGLERLVLVGEDVLAAQLKPDKAPSVSEAMRKLNTTDMRLAWQDWVPLLQTAVNRDFTLQELPETAVEPEQEPPPAARKS
jgi:hypothetical protein